MARAHRRDERIIGVVRRRAQPLRAAAALSAAYRSRLPCRSRWSARNVEHDGRSGARLRGRLELEARDLQHVDVRGLAEQIERGRTQVAAGRRAEALAPPACAAAESSRCSCRSSRSPQAPALRAARANSSTSPSTSSPRRRASTASGRSSARPGDNSTRLARSSQRGSSVSSSTRPSGTAARSSARPGGAERLSITSTARRGREIARDRSARAPRPTTRL